MSHPRATLDDTLANVRDWFQGHFDELTAFSAALTSELHLDAHGLLNMTDANRRRMKATSTAFLAEHPVVDGCGLIFAHSALGTDNGRLEWWVREEESRFARYSFGVVPGADRYYDYEQHEWFVRAFVEGRSAAVGPYIDYLGVDLYIITLTMPAVVAGKRVGAVGTDIQVDDLERALLPLLLRCDSELALLSRHGNVLLSNSARWMPGELVSTPPEGARFEPLSEVTDGMRVLVLSRRSG